MVQGISFWESVIWSQWPSSDHPLTIATKQNGGSMKGQIKEDQQVTQNEIKLKDSFSRSSGSLDQILHYKLGVWKHCAYWVPHQQRRGGGGGRVEQYLYMLWNFARGRSEQFWDIVTGDKTFIYWYDLETKQQSSIWLFPGESPSEIQAMDITPACLRSLRLGVHAVQTPAPVVCCSTMTSQCPHHHHYHSGPPAQKLHLAGHPNSYFPNLAPCDFFLFPLVKKWQLNGEQFQIIEDAQVFM